MNLTRPLVVLDLETTGLDPAVDRIVEIAMIRLAPGLEQDDWCVRVDPQMPISLEATAVHGITNEDVVGIETFEQIALQVRDFLENADLCGYNLIGFDLKVLVSEFQRAKVDFKYGNRSLIDPKRIFFRENPRDLAAAVRAYLFHDHAGAHGAKSDAQATLDVLEAMIIRHENLRVPADALSEMKLDAGLVDLEGFFTRQNDVIVFAKGKHKGARLDLIASAHRDYLNWMLAQPMLPDTHHFVRQAMKGKV